MNQTPANLMVAVVDQVVCVKISGRANFTSSLDLKRLISELWDRGFRQFVFDLTDCLMMDSTFLGVLSGIGLKFSDARGKVHGDQIELFNPNPRIAEVLENLGVSHLFKFCSRDDARATPEQYEPLAHQAVSRVDVTRTCLEAHQLLMSLNPDNVHKFKDVAQFLAEDLKRLEAEKSAS